MGNDPLNNFNYFCGCKGNTDNENQNQEKVSIS